MLLAKKNSNFMLGFKSAILAKLKNCQNYENGNKKNIHNLSKGPPNPGFLQEKVQKGDFLKKDLRELTFFVLF